jgi:ketosteroid isomerase-like protein
MSMVEFRQPTTDQALLEVAESVHQAWNDALARNDAEALAALYADDAVIESPLVAYLLGTERGICSGKQAIRNFLPKVFANQPEERQTYRHPVFTDGKLLMWEYPRATPDGDQMDFTEVMELENGLIRRHRVYWGWFGVRTLTTGSHQR